MLLDTDYVIWKTSHDTILFWEGRRGWSAHPSCVHIYKTRKRAEASMKRNDWRFDRTVGYSTYSEAREIWAERLPAMYGSVPDCYISCHPDACAECGQITHFYIFPKNDPEYLTKPWCGCGYKGDCNE